MNNEYSTETCVERGNLKIYITLNTNNMAIGEEVAGSKPDKGYVNFYIF